MMTAKQWGLYDDAAEVIGEAGLRMAVKALNQALRLMADVVRKEAAASGGLRGAKLNDVIERVLDDHWEDVAATYKKAGAADTEVRERAARVLRKIAKGMQEGVSMGRLLSLTEAKRTIPRELPVTEAVLKALMEMDRALTAEVTDLAEKDEELRKAYYAFTDGLGGFQRALNDYRKRVRAAWNQK